MRGDYSNGRIYFVEPICDHEKNEVYYGSTLQMLCKRMDFHRGSYKSWKNGKSTKVMCYDLFEKYGLENCKIYLVELYPCKSKEELEAREGYFIRNYNCVNKVIPGRTSKEYYKDNKERMYKKNKEYYNSNKDKMSEYHKDYRNSNKDKISEYHKEYHKENYKKNKDAILKRASEYKEQNKEILQTKYECPCGGRYIYANKLQHFKTKKHIKYTEQQNKEE